MIQEEYCKFETCKLLKEAGFPQDRDLYDPIYTEDGELSEYKYFSPNDFSCVAQSQAMRWLREEHSISVEPSVTIDEQWSLNVFDFKTVDIIADDEVDRFPTYEAAAEAGIQAACKYLIGKSQTEMIREEYIQFENAETLTKTNPQ